MSPLQVHTIAMCMNASFIVLSNTNFGTDLTFSSSLEELLVQGFNFPIIDDTVVESTEQVKLFLNTSQEGVVIGADADVATVNIFNDDSENQI